MSDYVLFVYVWPVVGTVFMIIFGLFLARRDRILYERYQADQARRRAYEPTQPTNAATPIPAKADA